MSGRDENIEWHEVDFNAASELTKATKAPDQVYRFDISNAPENFTRMPGACSYFVSAYKNPVEISGEVKVGGEMVVGRTHKDLLKNYLYYFASSSDGKVCFAGPYKDFYGHHIASSEPVDIETLFGSGPLSKITKP